MRSVFLFLFFLQSVFGFCQEAFNVDSVTKFQNKLNTEFADATTSPLEKSDRVGFKSLDFFPIHKNFFVIAQFVRTEKEKPFKMKTSTDRKPVYVKYGEVHFAIDGKNLKLNVYRNIELSRKAEYKDYLFLPFSDLTSGKESYIGGRYIDLSIPKGNTIAIDFNTAYNPYCTYSSNYSCPKVPLENDLNIEIKAGVKKFHD
jgi:uncharacterized protein